jgi:hypothetical protein
MSNQKVIILTGASRGIGLAIAKHLLGEGHKVVLVARTAGPLEKLREEFGALVEVFVADVREFEVRNLCFPFILSFIGFLQGGTRGKCSGEDIVELCFSSYVSSDLCFSVHSRFLDL